MFIKYYYLLIAFSVFTIAPNIAKSATISITPNTQLVSQGDIIDVGINISGLGVGGAPSLSIFDLDVLFDTTHLSYIGTSFGDPILGDQLDLFGFGSIISDFESVGALNLFELSFDFPNDLDDFQANSFTLATVSFSTLSAATSTIDIAIYSLGDSLGNAITANTISGTIESQEKPGTVPEPTTILLLLSGIGFLRIYKRSI